MTTTAIRFLDRMPGGKFERGDKVSLSDAHPTLTFEVLSILPQQGGEPFYRVVRLLIGGRHAESDKRIVRESKMASVIAG